ncbi:PspC domain-containing protein [Streptococcus cuniculipharyngis]|uniref:PspC domain-containing protein n=1 Tax=Streptococcus cuniculipharyngis TaxID=1562651 RepID=A0A5C5SEN8_9STRE|nr:PspC domain-containing protein [Streptococcus cuniculipharyngis]TWS98251.1 PspC domain-containing protein [Streptococcus cuniculipharyngis]
MTSAFYKLKRGRVVSGVIAGLADKFGWDLSLARVLTAIFIYFSGGFGLFLYIVMASILPYKLEEKETYSQQARGRRRKEAKVVEDDDWVW